MPDLLILAGLVLTAFGLGGMLGVRCERMQWLVKGRSRPEYRTAHHCDDEFWYVIPEGEFLREYQRRQQPPNP